MIEQIELRHIRYFMAVAEEQHFGRAALRMGIQQPPLSQQVQKLESMIGYRLFDRTSKGATLTAGGRALLPIARRALATLSEGVETGRLASHGFEGSLTVAFAASLLSTKLPALIREFRAGHPRVKLALREMTTDAQLDAIRRGQVDLGFARETEGAAPEVVSERLFREPLYVVLPRDHRLAKAGRWRVRDLAKEPFVLFPRAAGHEFHDCITGVCRAADAGFVPEIVQEATEWFTIVRLVGAGLGVTIAPASVLALCDEAVVSRKLTPVSGTWVVLVGSGSGAASPTVEAFRRLARKRLVL